MNIAQLKEMPTGSKTGGGFKMAVKTIKKAWQVGEKWMQQIVLMDETGEMLADVNLGKNCTNLRGKIGKEIKVIVCEVQDSEHMGKPCKKLYIDQWDIDVWQGDPADLLDPQAKEWEAKREDEIRSKIRCWLVAAVLQQGGREIKDTKKFKKYINGFVEFVLTGE